MQLPLLKVAKNVVVVAVRINFQLSFPHTFLETDISSGSSRADGRLRGFLQRCSSSICPPERLGRASSWVSSCKNEQLVRLRVYVTLNIRTNKLQKCSYAEEFITLYF